MLPTTTTLLLESLKDPARDATWREFDERYRPVLQAFARRLGLTAQDAQEVAQETLATFATDYLDGKYDPQRGRLRSWLFKIAQTRVARTWRSRRREQAPRGESVLAELPDEDAMSELFEAEWRAEMLRIGWRALREDGRTDERTLRVFEALTFEERPAREVAAAFGMEPNAVYQIKSRVTAKLRVALAALEEGA